MTLYRTIYNQKKAEYCRVHSKEILDMVHTDPRYIEHKTNKKSGENKVNRDSKNVKGSLIN